MQPPAAIIFVNDTTNTSFLNVLQTNVVTDQTIDGTLANQLEATETISFAEFNARVAADPNYPTIVHLNGLRIVVILSDFSDYTNRNLADIVIFIKQGLASVEKNNFGPPGLSLDVQRLNIWNLINGIKRTSGVCQSPFPRYLPPPQTQTEQNPKPPFHLRPHHIEGLGALELFGVENLEGNGIDEGVFGDKLRDNDDDDEDEDEEGDDR